MATEPASDQATDAPAGTPPARDVRHAPRSAGAGAADRRSPGPLR